MGTQGSILREPDVELTNSQLLSNQLKGKSVKQHRNHVKTSQGCDAVDEIFKNAVGFCAELEKQSSLAEQEFLSQLVQEISDRRNTFLKSCTDEFTHAGPTIKHDKKTHQHGCCI